MPDQTVFSITQLEALSVPIGTVVAVSSVLRTDGHTDTYVKTATGWIRTGGSVIY